jgi:A/G-specific adenine glycosylase
VVAMPRVKEFFGENVRIIENYPIKKHVLTHQHIHAQFIHIENKPVKLEQEWFYTEEKNLENLAMPKIIFIFLNNLFSL